MHVGLPGEVISMEFRTTSASLAVADRAVTMPAYNADEYPAAMRAWFDTERPDLFLSLNDYEHEVLSRGLADQLREYGCRVAALEEGGQETVSDKFSMAKALRAHGIASPVTHLGTESHDLARQGPADRMFVVKHRFGSGSTGLRIVEAAHLEAAVADSARTALNRRGLPAYGDLSHVIVQDRLLGAEFGADGVFSVDGRAQLLGVLARRKVQMRSGATDVATSVDAERFRDLVGRIGSLIRPSALIDLDIIESADGELHVIDINPRFGGGYPFVHLAGADAPAVLIQAAAGLEPDLSLLAYEEGVTSARGETFAVVSRASTPSPLSA
ncbi:ATP-grasp domain-containing protein [Georgenia daeguensis]|uniref:ATP-grasp domain-containing protein n=1 Tax=Georgenia daeguensis TaxID=908355 RepID=A0ABP8EYN6_9MICO